MNILYLFYYFKKMNWGQYFKFAKYASDLKNKSILSLVLKSMSDSINYKISPTEYFQFRFFEIDKNEKVSWAGTGYMYEYQKIMNPPSERKILDNKTIFYKKYRKYFVHHVYDINELENDISLATALLDSEKIVLKISNGKCGVGVLFIESKDYTVATLIDFMRNNSYELAETYIFQHPDLMALSPTAVNTVRIFTQLNKNGDVDLLGCRLRISVNSVIDNMAAGNLAVAIDDNSGIIIGPGVYSDITKNDEVIHPATGIPIVGFQVPLWSECVQLAKNAAKEHPQNKSIGWDIVVTNNGPGLIEGNHDWCKLVWQLPVKRGLKENLKQYV